MASIFGRQLSVLWSHKCVTHTRWHGSLQTELLYIIRTGELRKWQNNSEITWITGHRATTIHSEINENEILFRKSTQSQVGSYVRRPNILMCVLGQCDRSIQFDWILFRSFWTFAGCVHLPDLPLCQLHNGHNSRLAMSMWRYKSKINFISIAQTAQWRCMELKSRVWRRWKRERERKKKTNGNWIICCRRINYCIVSLQETEN